MKIDVENLKALKERCSNLTEESKADQLIKIKLKELDPLLNELDGIKKASDPVRSNIKSINEYLLKSNKFEERSIKENENAQKFQEMMVNLKLELSNIEQRYQTVLEKNLPKMQEIEGMIIARDKELKDLAAYRANSEQNNNQSPLILKMKELDKLVANTQALKQGLKEVNVNALAAKYKDDPEINLLVQKHQQIYSPVKASEESRTKTLQEIAKNIHQYPLESNRVDAKIKILGRFAEQLNETTEALEKNLTAITEAIALRNQTAEAIALALLTIESNIEEALQKLNKIKEIKAYYTTYNNNIDSALSQLTTIKKNLERSLLNPQEDITQKLASTKQEIADIVWSVSTNVYKKNTTFNNQVSDVRDRLNKVIKEQNLNIQSLPQYLNELLEKLNQLTGSDREPRALNEEKLKDIDIIIEKLITDDLAAKALNKEQLKDSHAIINATHQHFIKGKLKEVKQKEVLELSAIIKEMTDSIQAEINSIKQTNSSDKRLFILTSTQSELSVSTCITGAISAIQDNLSGDNLKTLSNDVLHPFLLFFRNLLQPLVNIVKKMTGEHYRPSLFATSTESNVAKAAEEAHKKLTALTGMIDNKLDLKEPAPTAPRS